MTKVTCQIATSVWAIITYEDTWKSYINQYVIAQNDTYLLIDTNMKKHRATVLQALEKVGATREKIRQVYCTHRHPDHIGNVEWFRVRNNWIHLHDYLELDDFSQTLFGHTITGSSGSVPFLQYVHLPGHTEGSVAYFDPEYKICFTGDHLSFFGTHLPEKTEEIVGFHPELRKAFLANVRQLKEEKDPEEVEAFVLGLQRMIQWPIEILATGHGPVLKGDISGFFQDIMRVVE